MRNVSMMGLSIQMVRSFVEVFRILTPLFPWNECGISKTTIPDNNISELRTLRAQWWELYLDLYCKFSLASGFCLCSHMEPPYRKIWKEETTEEELVSLLLNVRDWDALPEFQPDPDRICSICGLYQKM
jgi:hypothetical protein